MKINNRINYFKKISQQAINTLIPQQSTKVDIRQVPGFDLNLFGLRQDLISNLNQIVNIINTYLNSLSDGYISFKLTYTNPSIDASEYSNSTKIFFSLQNGYTQL